MNAHYYMVCNYILKHRESKDAIVRKTVITLIPHLAAYDPQSFCDQNGGTSFLTTSMRHLLSQLKKPEKAHGQSLQYSATKSPRTKEI